MFAPGHDPVLLDATLRPSPPSSPFVLKLVVAIVASVNLASGLFFVLRGAWFVTPFMGADVALLAWAFWASVRAARRHECVTLSHSRLVVKRHPARGPVSEIVLNPYWVRVDMADPPDHWSQVELWSHGRAVRVGSFLAPQERLSFAQALKAALRRAKETIPA